MEYVTPTIAGSAETTAVPAIAAAAVAAAKVVGAVAVKVASTSFVQGIAGGVLANVVSSAISIFK